MMTETAATGVFISYSRKETKFAEKLMADLIDNGFDAYLDVEDIVKGEPWRERLRQLIEKADAIVFLISPNSVKSKVCDWEINEAELLAKRILPVVCKPTENDQIPQRLQRLNYTFLETEARRSTEFPKLLKSLREDARLVREHTRLGVEAKRWDRSNRSRSLLLHGPEVEAAEAWRDEVAATRTKASKLHLEYIAASRQWASSILYMWIVGSLAAAVVSAALAAYAFWQRNETLKNQAITQWKTGILYRDELGLSTAAANWFAQAAASPDEAMRDSARLAANQAMRGVTLESIENVPPFEAKGDSHVLASSDDNLYAVHGDKTDILYLWSIPGNECIHAWSAKSGLEQSCEPGSDSTNSNFEIDGVRFTEAGDGIISWHSDYTVKVWAVDGQGKAASLPCANGKPPMQHDKKVRGALLNSPSSQVISWGEDKSIRVWDLCSHQEIERFMHDDWVLGASLVPFSPFPTRLPGPDDKVLSWSKDKTVRLWQPGNPQSIFTGTHNDEVLGAEFAPIDRIISWGRDNTVRFWDINSKRQALSELHHAATVRKVEIEEGGRQITSRSDDGTLHRWEVDNGHSPYEGRDLISIGLEHGPKSKGVLGGAFNDAGDIVLTWDKDKQIRLWDPKTGRQLERTKPIRHKKRVNGASFVNDGTQLVSWSNDETIRIWNVSDEPVETPPWNHSDDVLSAVIDEDKRQILSLSKDGKVWLWPMDREVETVEPLVCQHPDEVEGALFNREKIQFLSWGSQGELALGRAGKDARCGDPQVFHTGPVNGAVYDRNEKRILSWGSDGEINILQVDGTRLVEKEAPMKFKRSIMHALFSPDESRILASDKDGNVFFCRVADRYRLEKCRSDLEYEGPIQSLQFSQDGKYVTGFTSDGIVFLIDVKSGQELRRFSHPIGLSDTENPPGAIFDPSGFRIMSWSNAGEVRLWNNSTGDPVVAGMLHGEGLRHALFDSAGQQVLSWGGKVLGARVWNLSYKRQEEQTADSLKCLVACKTGTEMTGEEELRVLGRDERLELCGGDFDNYECS